VGGVPVLPLGGTPWEWGWIGQFLVLVGMVWLVNLYNFMDGIDGIAGVEAVCAAGFGAGLLATHGMPGLAAVAAVLAASCAGFLFWNWPPAKIFMGDVGSGFLGFSFGLLAVGSARQQAPLLWPWLILLLLFVVDATVTLLRRFFGGERWYEAHRSHAYQHASRRWGHRTVTQMVAALNVVWLFPLSWAATAWPRLAFAFTVVAALPLVCLAVYLKAGSAAGRLSRLEEAGVTHG
jgi:Fuc2NAc and GlcNAc transferase